MEKIWLYILCTSLFKIYEASEKGVRRWMAGAVNSTTKLKLRDYKQYNKIFEMVERRRLILTGKNPRNYVPTIINI